LNSDVFRIPTDAEISDAEAKLRVRFPDAYREFLKTGGNVGNAKFEAAVVVPNAGHLDIVEIAEAAWASGVPRTLVPFVEDNGDYFCVSAHGEVMYWSHIGGTGEQWPTFQAWFQQVCIERR